jgi:hypothetical protein
VPKSEQHSTGLRAQTRVLIASWMYQRRSSRLMMLRVKVSSQQMAMPWEVGRGAHCDHVLERRWSVATVVGLGRPLF